MLKFNNNHIVTGYIKQMLASFNLPKMDVLTDLSKSIPGREYIYRDNIITTTIDKIDSPRIIMSYYLNKFILNRTKNLIIANNIYDTYTHEYLGDYLRFMRDYQQLDLMPLYNCFSNKICTNLSYTDGPISFDSTDTNYKIYMLPIKLFKEYTIAIDCNSNVELMCGLFGKYLSKTEINSTIMNSTYVKLTDTKFGQPFIYDKLVNINTEYFIKNNINDLKLFIKMPISNTSSITILEGNYLKYNDFKLDTEYKIINNHTQLNFETNSSIDNTNIKLISPISLLAVNTGISYPFADRLIEYLVDNSITHLAELSDNIKRVQTIISDNNLPIHYYGIWDDSLKQYLYDYIINKSNIQGQQYDILGYVDKTVEKLYKSDLNNLSTVDIYNYISEEDN